MNRTVLTALADKLCTPAFMQTATTSLYTGNSLRGIHVWVRPMRYALRYRRRYLEKKNPAPKPPPHRNTFSDWNYNSELFAFGKRLNEEIDDALLRQAFTDRSFVTAERLKQEELGLNVEDFNLKDNEYMSSEGKNILKNVLADTLSTEYPRFPKEGIQAVVDYLASDPVLASISSLIGTKDLIQCKEIPPKEDTFARAFCAIVSAIEKTSGHEQATVFIQDFVATHLCDKDINEIWTIQKPWAMLADILSAKGEKFEPRLMREAGKNTILSVFVVGLYNSEKKLIGSAPGETVEIAQEMAARDALSRIFDTRYPRPPFKFLSERVSNGAKIKATVKTPQIQARN